MFKNRELIHPLRQERQAQGLSMRELAFFADCAHTTISRLEKGEINAPSALKARIAHALRVPVEVLWEPSTPTEDGSRA